MDVDTRSLLQQAAAGDERAADQLMPVVYQELRQIADRLDRHGLLSLPPTAIVHEAYLKLVGATKLEWKDRTHFVAIAARAMGQVVCDHARALGRAKRGGGWHRVTLADVADSNGSPGAPLDVEVTALNDALEQLRERDERAASVVVMRFFGGLSNEDIAEVLGVTSRTVRNDWTMARAWLHCELTGPSGADP